MQDFILRTETHELAFPSACAFCHSDTLPLVDTFAEGVGGNRLYICPGCVKLTLALFGVVPSEEVTKLGVQLNSASAAYQGAAGELATAQARLKKLFKERDHLDDEVTTLRAENAASRESHGRMRERLRDLETGRQTAGELRDEILVAAGGAPKS